MIIIDGNKFGKEIKDYANLEELFKDVMSDERMAGRVPTDVFVNDESFSEIYPHQAEDMSTDDITSVRIVTMAMDKMAVEISGEMDKVAKLMSSGASNVARLLREGANTDGMELFQDLLDVTRDFMSLIANIRDKYLLQIGIDFQDQTEKFSDLLTEMSEVLENEDWILLADLLEYEFLPACKEWEEASKLAYEKMSGLVAAL